MKHINTLTSVAQQVVSLISDGGRAFSPTLVTYSQGDKSYYYITYK